MPRKRSRSTSRKTKKYSKKAKRSSTASGGMPSFYSYLGQRPMTARPDRSIGINKKVLPSSKVENLTKVKENSLQNEALSFVKGVGLKTMSKFQDKLIDSSVKSFLGSDTYKIGSSLMKKGLSGLATALGGALGGAVANLTLDSLESIGMPKASSMMNKESDSLFPRNIANASPAAQKIMERFKKPGNKLSIDDFVMVDPYNGIGVFDDDDFKDMMNDDDSFSVEFNLPRWARSPSGSDYELEIIEPPDTATQNLREALAYLDSFDLGDTTRDYSPYKPPREDNDLISLLSLHRSKY